MTQQQVFARIQAQKEANLKSIVFSSIAGEILDRETIENLKIMGYSVSRLPRTIYPFRAKVCRVVWL